MPLFPASTDAIRKDTVLPTTPIQHVARKRDAGRGHRMDVLVLVVVRV